MFTDPNEHKPYNKLSMAPLKQSKQSQLKKNYVEVGLKKKSKVKMLLNLNLLKKKNTPIIPDEKSYTIEDQKNKNKNFNIITQKINSIDNEIIENYELLNNAINELTTDIKKIYKIYVNITINQNILKQLLEKNIYENNLVDILKDVNNIND